MKILMGNLKQKDPAIGRQEQGLYLSNVGLSRFLVNLYFISSIETFTIFCSILPFLNKRCYEKKTAIVYNICPIDHNTVHRHSPQHKRSTLLFNKGYLAQLLARQTRDLAVSDTNLSSCCN